MKPFVETLSGQALPQHARTYICGLLSDVERTNVASIAYRFGQERLPLQRCIGWAAWDDTPLRQELIGQVAQPLGQADGVLVCDPSALAKSGTESVGVARQWGGRLGKVDHCPVALSLGDVSAQGHTLVDMRLSLPKAWLQDKARLDQAGVPTARRGYRTRHQLALERLEQHGTTVPQRWMAGDDERGRPYWLRRRLAALGERSRLAGPSNTLIRALETAPPEASGRGRPPTRLWQRVEPGSQALSADAWRRVDVRDGSKGPLVVDVVKRRVVSRTHRRQQGHEEMVVVMRSRDRDNQQVVQVAEYLSNAEPETPLWEFARVAQAAHRMEECLQRRKREAGLADDEVRHWTGWHHHQTLSLLATWLLVTEPQRGKKMDASDDVTAETDGHRGDLVQRVSVRNDITCAA
jgi:SRSO17 transposase